MSASEHAPSSSQKGIKVSIFSAREVFADQGVRDTWKLQGEQRRSVGKVMCAHVLYPRDHSLCLSDNALQPSDYALKPRDLTLLSSDTQL